MKSLNKLLSILFFILFLFTTSKAQIKSNNYLFNYKKKINLKAFIRELNESYYIDTAYIQKEILFLKFTNSDSFNYFSNAPFYNDSWSYRYFHKIYHFVFRYNAINAVSITQSKYSFTVVPCRGFDDYYLFPKNILYRKDYFYNLDYGKYLQRKPNFSEVIDGELYIKKQLLKFILIKSNYGRSNK
jgi:hypothetical protein